MSDVPIRGRFHQRHRGVVHGDALLTGVRAATDRQDHVRCIAAHAVDERQRRVGVDAADQRCKKQTLGVAIATVDERLGGRSPLDETHGCDLKNATILQHDAT